MLCKAVQLTEIYFEEKKYSLAVMGRDGQWTRIPVVWEDNKLKAATEYKKFQINKSHIVKKYTNEYYQNEDL